MAWGHEIWDGIHVWEQSMDFDWLAQMIGEPLRLNGSCGGRRTLIVVLLSTKLELSQKVFDKVQGVDYDEIFSLVSMLKSVRIMLAIAAFYEIWQMDKQNCIP